VSEDWAVFSRRLFALYQAAEYEQALEEVREGAGRFPERVATTTFWRACLESRSGDPEAALATLREGVDHGLWWAEDTLRRDDDLEPVWKVPEFEALVEECVRRRERTKGTVAPEVHVREPEHDNGSRPLVIALHGRMGRAEDALGSWRAVVSAGAVLAVPRSVQLLSPDTYGWDDLEAGARQVGDDYARLLAERRFDAEKVVLAGFSQGAALAVIEAVRGDRVPACGFVAVAPSFGEAPRLQQPGVDELKAAAARSLRGCVLTGENDVLLEPTLQFQAAAEAAGLELRVEIEPGLGHEFPPDLDERIPRALDFVLAGTARASTV
jgi:dienelactone hydrolase